MKSLFFLKVLFSILFSNMDMVKVLFKLTEACFFNAFYDVLKHLFLPSVGMLMLRKKQGALHLQARKRAVPRHPEKARKKAPVPHTRNFSVSVSERNVDTNLTRHGKSVFILKTKNKTFIFIVL